MASKYPLSAFRCGCELCAAGTDLEARAAHERINLLLIRLDEQQRRWTVAILAEQVGLHKGGVRALAQITGMSEKTIRRGIKDLHGHFEDRIENRVRKPGAGRPTKDRMPARNKRRW